MLLKKRPEKHDDTNATSPLAMLRDIVEIVAIVAAGVWAFYTFVYENEIKPESVKPEAQVESSLSRLAQRDGLIAVHAHAAIRNVGATDIWLYGFAETVVGSKVRPRSSRAYAPKTGNPTSRLEQPGWIASRPTSVFAFAFLTKLGDSRSMSGFNLRPGQTAPLDRTFYVPSGRYDELQTHVSLRFAAHDTPIPFYFATDSDGIIRLEPTQRVHVDSIDDYTATLSLWR